MIEASYGAPPPNSKDVVWVTLPELIQLQGSDPKKWIVKPHCPHCRCELHAHDVKGAAGFVLVAKEVAEHEAGKLKAGVGFRHPPGKAKSDCPYNYANDPRYAHEPGRGTGRMELKRNKEKLRESEVVIGNQAVLKFFMQRLTHRKEITREEQSLLGDIVKTRIIATQGLAEHSWLVPYMQMTLLGPILRAANKQEPAQKSLFEEENAATLKALARKQDREAAYRGAGFQTILFKNVHGETRELSVPSALQLCFVYPQKDGGVIYVPMRNPVTKATVEFEISVDFAKGISLPAAENRKKSDFVRSLARGRQDKRPPNMGRTKRQESVNSM